jgi:antitoxin PrlF
LTKVRLAVIILTNMSNSYSSPLTSKGQIVIPKPIRDALGLQPGDFLSFTMTKDSLTLKPSIAPHKMMGFIKAKGKSATQEEIDKAVADGVTEKYQDRS